MKGWGDLGFFVSVLATMGACLVIVAGLPRTDTQRPPHATGYLGLLRDRRLALPMLASACSGISYGFINGFVALLLSERGVAAVTFFAPFGAALLATRFVGMTWLQRLPPALAVAGGYGRAVRLCNGVQQHNGASSPQRHADGYRLRHHRAGLGALGDVHAPAERTRPVALVNTSFNLGSILAVQATGVLLPVIGWAGTTTMLDAVVAVVSLGSLAHAARRVHNGVIDDDLAALDREIDHLEQTLRLARECHFDGTATGIERDIRDIFLPQMLMLLAATDEDARKAIADRYRRLGALLR